MALDTRDRRSAAIGVGRPWMVRMPLANGSIGAGDRRHVAYAYPFITVGRVSFITLCPTSIVVPEATATIVVPEATASIKPGVC